MTDLTRRKFFRLAGAAAAATAATVAAPAAALSQFVADPAGAWIECDGQALSRAIHAALFRVIGTTYGAGDGVSTFNLPDLRPRWEARPIDRSFNAPCEAVCVNQFHHLIKACEGADGMPVGSLIMCAGAS